MVTLTSFLIFRGSPESKDGDEEMKDALERIERRLDGLTAQGRDGAARLGADGAARERVVPVSAD